MPKLVPTKTRSAKNLPRALGKINLLIKDTQVGIENPPNKAKMLKNTKNIINDKGDAGLIKNKVHTESTNHGNAYPILIKTIVFFF